MTRDALVKRINRKLATIGKRLRTLRGDRWVDVFGRHFIIDTATGEVVAWDVNALELGRALGVAGG